MEGLNKSESTKTVRCAAVISNEIGQLLVIRQGDTYSLPAREIAYTQSMNECIEAALREVQESCGPCGVHVDTATGQLELDTERSLLLVFGWVTERSGPKLRSTPDGAPSPLWLTRAKERQLASNLWNIYSSPSDLALSIALLMRSQTDNRRE